MKRADILPEGEAFFLLKEKENRACNPEKGFGRKAQAGLERMILPYEVIH